MQVEINFDDLKIPLQQNELLSKEANLLKELMTIDEVDESSLAALAKKVTKFYLEEYPKEMLPLQDNEAYQQRRDQIVTTIANLLISKLDSVSSPEIKADLLECFFYLTGCSSRMDGKSVEEYLKKIIKAKDSELITALLHRSLSVGITVLTTIDKEKYTSYANLTDCEKMTILPNLVEGAAFLSIQWAEASGFEVLGVGNEIIIWALRTLNIDSASVDNSTEALSKIETAILLYEHFFAKNKNQITVSYPSHGTSRSIIEALTLLYESYPKRAKMADPDLKIFLKSLYANKVLRFSSKNNLISLHQDIIVLVKILEYDPVEFIAESSAVISSAN